MNIHKELEQLRRDHKLIADRIDEIQQQLEPEITEGQYFKRNDALYRIMGKCRDAVFPWHVKRVGGNPDMPDVDKFNNDILAYGLLCDDEVEQALIKEAKRRGLIDGIKVKRPSTYLTMQTTGIINRELSTKYVTSCDRLEFGGVTVYQDGEWEIKQYDLPGSQYYVSNGNREIDGVMESLSKKEAQVIANALNNLDK